ncbi:MAG: DUF481 domain-containing protein [Phycisphaerales bacterium]|nr:DUF481 domain-containing protein [Phycisphaerales bacterium]
MHRFAIAGLVVIAAAGASASAQFAALTQRAADVQPSTGSGGAPGTVVRFAPALTLSNFQDGGEEAVEALPPESFWEGWDGSVAFGLNGNQGNTENLSLRTSLAARRPTPTMETTLGFVYAYSTRDSEATENRARFDARNDWLFGEDSRWRYFISGFVEYDEFQDWDLRVGAFTGFGYDFIKSERTVLTGRAGLGATHRFGGEDEDTRFEGLLGVDWTHQLNDRNKLYASATYYPDFSDVPEFRVEARAGWEIQLDESNGMFLNLGVEDRYDSNPGGDSENNDFAYFALLGWNF